ncbi:MAG: DUF4190 domain-containing protein [Bacteroidota bacterium]|nr:DUF4190 domain-containing protein [Bacteroidota bacterium]
MPVTRSLALILLCTSICWSCNARYGYRSKVNTGKKENYQSKTDTKALLKEEKTQSPEEIITASVEKFRLIIIRPNLNSININKDSIQTLAQEKKIIRTHKVKKHTPANNVKPPVNYYAKWALIITLISLTTIPFIIPMILGPLDLLLGIVALIKIKKSHEKGKGRAIFAILTGLAFIALTAYILFIGIELPILYPTLPIALYILGFNLLLYSLIKNGKKNPANKEWVEKRTPLNKSTRHFILAAGIFALLTLTGSFMIITFGFGPITIMMAAKAIKNIPKGKSNGRTIAIISLVIGILGTIAVCIFVPWLLNIDGNYDGGYDIFFILVALATILITLLFSLIGFIILTTSINHEQEI